METILFICVYDVAVVVIVAISNDFQSHNLSSFSAHSFPSHAIRNKHDAKRKPIKFTNSIEGNKCERMRGDCAHIEWCEGKKQWTDTNRVESMGACKHIQGENKCTDKNISSTKKLRQHNTQKRIKRKELFISHMNYYTGSLACSLRTRSAHTLCKDLCAYFIVYSSYPI